MVKRALWVLMLVAAGGLALVWRLLPSPFAEDELAATTAWTAAGSALPRRGVGGLSPRAWSVVGGQLVPGRSLRDRFDSYLPLGRGVTMVEVRAALAQDAEADLGAANGAKVLALWDRYARLQTYEWRSPFNTADPKGWQATLDEQHAVRRQLLGPEWAQAFFAADELAMQERLSRALAARKPAKASLDALLAKASPAAGARVIPPVAGSGAASAAASHAVVLADPVWQQRVDEARAEWTRLNQDPSLDEGARLLRMRQYLQLNFSAAESKRAEAVLHLP